MTEKTNTIRIDEILRHEGVVTEEQIKAALEYQREHGGRLGSHLMHLGYVTESQLLSALAMQFGCETIVLTGFEIPSQVVQMIPANVALARTIMPFAFDPATNTLSIACEDPKDTALVEELNFVTRGMQVKLFVAAEVALRARITEHYMSASSGSELGPTPASAKPEVPSDMASPDDAISSRGVVLMVTDDSESDQPLKQSLELEEFEVVTTDSADDAIVLIEQQVFHAVFIRDTVPGDYIDLMDRLRKSSPSTSVRFYESVGQMLLKESAYEATSDLMAKNMQLFTTLLSEGDGATTNHAGTVGQYVSKLCRQMNLPDKERLNIVTAAYLHDISRHYYGESKAAPDCRTRVQMTVKLLDSLNYPPLVVGILKSMYINLQQKYTKRLPIEALGGSIITIVDLFCERVSFDRRMSLDKFEVVRTNLMAMSGHLFLEEVVTAFMTLMEAEILIEPDEQARTFNQVLMYCEDMDYLTAIAGRIKEEGFRPVSLDDVDRFVEMYQRSRPDIMILLQEGLSSNVNDLIKELTRKGVDVASAPTYLVVSRQAVPELAPLLEKGLEDVIPIENSLDLLIVKLQNLRSKIQDNADDTNSEEDTIVQANPTTGNLEDMSLIELLQVMAPNGTTARIKVTSENGKLTLCMDKGKIIFAQGDHAVGPEAIYEGVTWQSGKWVIQPVSEDELPEPNSHTTLETILIEGCRRLDEKPETRS